MSEVKVNKISPRTACGTVTLGDSGDTFTIPSGATITNSGTASGFGATGAVSWDTASIKTTGFTAVTGTGYFCNTTGGIFTVALPAGSAGDVVGLADYAQTFATNNLTVSADGSEKIGGSTNDGLMSTNGVAVTFIYVDSTRGWIVTDSGSSDDLPIPLFVTATGGTPSQSGDYEIRTFTGPGTFCVSCAGNAAGSTTIDYMIVAGGAGGGVGHSPSGEGGGGGGAGGWRASAGTGSGCYTAGPSPLTAPVSPVTVSASPGAYAIVVGGGGALSNAGSCVVGNDGNVSSGFSITSAGGGGGGTRSYLTPDTGRASGNPGGSGGGAAFSGPAGTTGAVGAGNTPPESPAQGTSGGLRVSEGGGGGGGATVAGTTPSPPATGGTGGTGATSCITGSPVGYSGGGGGGAPTTGGPATQGGGAGGTGSGVGTAGGCNTGGGGGGGKGPQCSGAGGSGVVIIRYKFQ